MLLRAASRCPTGQAKIIASLVSGVSEIPAGWRSGTKLNRNTVSLSHRVGFWTVALAFLVVMAVGALPTPLYVLYERRDHFSGLIVTVIFAAYAVGVVASLFLAGHVSDWFGRRPVLVSAILFNAVSAAVFAACRSFQACSWRARRDDRDGNCVPGRTARRPRVAGVGAARVGTARGARGDRREPRGHGG